MYASVKSRSYFSIPYLCGAARYARESLALELGKPTDERALLHRAYVVSAVTNAAAALEAMINEAFADATEPEGGCVQELSIEARSKLARMWAVPKTSKFAILDKFDVAHLLITGQGLDRSHHRWRNASWVVRLRNEFVHFEPSWQQHGERSPNEQEKVERGLKGLFAENAIAGTGNPFFPDKLLGHGCAEWSVLSALDFADNFWAGIGCQPPYQTHKHLFATREWPE